MKKLTTLITLLALLYVGGSCSDSPVSEMEKAATSAARTDGEAVPFGMLRSCATMDVLNTQLAEDPDMKNRMSKIESFTNQVISNQIGVTPTIPNGFTITIPVVVNVLWKTAQENISMAQIQSQIDVLNEDFGNTNADLKNIPSGFKALIGKMNIRFALAGVVRKQTNKSYWGFNDAIKKTAKGGINPINPAKYLNIWIGNIDPYTLGYAQFPGGDPATDGIVIGPNFFGRVGFLSPPFDKGRTATHEIGHWLNLYHIWGDDGNNCWGTDLVADTPNAAGPNFGCPGYPRITCGNGPKGDLFMNYMDYTDDACMFMFTTGQMNRSRALFAPGGPRSSFIP
ncbi:MAG: zinc metalloprotease [Spirosomataceae bacterium]